MKIQWNTMIKFLSKNLFSKIPPQDDKFEIWAEDENGNILKFNRNPETKEIFAIFYNDKRYTNFNEFQRLYSIESRK